MLAESAPNVARPDVQSFLGLDASYTNSGYRLRFVRTPGALTYTVCARRTYDGVFARQETRTLNVTQSALLIIDGPGNNQAVPNTFNIGGWSFDNARGSGNGPGIRRVDASAGSSCPAAVTTTGRVGASADPLNVQRTDVRVAYNLDASYEFVGFNFPVTIAQSGAFTFVLCAVSSVADFYLVQATRMVNVTDRTCSGSDRTVDLISASLYTSRRVQELTDMQVTTDAGINVLSGPTLNAARVRTIAWGQPITVYNRITFLQTSFDPQVWYQVSPSSGSTNADWIVVRYENVNYLYAADPCADVYTSSPTSLTYPYNRAAAAEYAIAQAYQNNSNPIPSSANRVTRRIGIRFANFYYSDLGGAGESTGSAVFVSESIWMGGLPMTIGNPNSCTTPNFVDAGWRFCWLGATSTQSSTPWRVHKFLGEYYTTATIPIPSGGGPNDVLNYNGYPNQGSQIFFNGTVNPDRIVAADIEPFIGDVDLGGDSAAFNPNQISSFAQTQLSQLKAGDYVWINTVNGALGSPHGLIVVGWRAPVTCSSAIASTFTSSNFSLTSTSNSVPYVADYTTAQSPVARPFYCTEYDQPGKANFLEHSWRFYRFADQLVLPYSSIYVDALWQWSATDGQ